MAFLCWLRRGKYSIPLSAKLLMQCFDAVFLSNFRICSTHYSPLRRTLACFSCMRFSKQVSKVYKVYALPEIKIYQFGEAMVFKRYSICSYVPFLTDQEACLILTGSGNEQMSIYYLFYWVWNSFSSFAFIFLFEFKLLDLYFINGLIKQT